MNLLQHTEEREITLQAKQDKFDCVFHSAGQGVTDNVGDIKNRDDARADGIACVLRQHVLVYALLAIGLSAVPAQGVHRVTK